MVSCNENFFALLHSELALPLPLGARAFWNTFDSDDEKFGKTK